MGVRRLTHLGLCVSDLDRSLAFYEQVLGFKEVGRFSGDGDPSASLIEVPDLQLRAVYLERDGWRLELLHYPSPGHLGTGERRPMNLLGLTHLSFRVADLDAVLAAIEARGGRVLRHTCLASHPEVRAIMALDPDGTRLELIEAPGDPNAIPGSGH
jgi:catechol 2,3-dioxygenase-like lactoylglutathione lyase family enzyme